MPRINKNHVINKANIVNSLLGFNTKTDTHCTEIGAVRLYSVSGDTYMVVRASNDHGGISQLSESGTLREASKFLDGMRAGLSIVELQKAGLDAL